MLRPHFTRVLSVPKGFLSAQARPSEAATLFVLYRLVIPTMAENAGDDLGVEPTELSTWAVHNPTVDFGARNPLLPDNHDFVDSVEDPLLVNAACHVVLEPVVPIKVPSVVGRFP